MIDLPTGRQAFDFSCGPKALQIILAYYGVDVREGDLIDELRCDYRGAPIKKIISFARKQGFQVFAKCGVSLETVKRYIGEKHPVIVLVQAWAERYMTPEAWKEDYDDGHYVIVIGFENGIVIFEDPSTISIRRTWMREEEFIVRWHDMDPRTQVKLEHFAMVLLGKKPASKTPQHLD